MADVVVTNDVDTFLKSANQAAMRTNIGAGTIATQDANNVSITGGSVAGITDLAIADGGTGASTASAARTNLEVYSDAEVDAKVATKATAGGVALTGGSSVLTAIAGESFITPNPFTVSVMVNIQDFSVNNGRIISQDDGALRNWAIGILSDGRIEFFAFSNGAATDFTIYRLASGVVSVGKWTHLLMTIDNTTVKIYVDGIDTAYTTAVTGNGFNGTFGATNTQLRLGIRNSTGSATCANFKTQDVRIFNRALTAAEVADLYESGTVAVADRWGNPTPIMDASTLNGGFESAGAGGADVFANWIEFVSGTSAITRDTVEYDTGAASCKIVTDGSNSSAYVYQSILTAGKKYRVTLRAKGGGTATNEKFNAQIGLGAGGFIFNGQAVTTSWQTFTGEGIAVGVDLVIGRNATGDAGQTLYFDGVTIEEIGAIADLPLDEGIGYQFHDRSSNHFDALASTTGVTHLVPKQTGKVRVKAADASSAMYMLRADSILPTDSIISNVLSEQCYVDLTNSAQTLDDYRIRLNPSGSDLQIQRSDGSNHATLGTVTAPSSLSDVDVQIHYEQVAR